MDLSKFKPSDWMKVGGGLLFFIAFFLFGFMLYSSIAAALGANAV